ncbi:MAG: DUF882 domain-containing protein [Pseudomonadota bacterium]
MAIVAGAALALPTQASAQSRTLELYFTHTKESIKVVYKRNGRYVHSGLRDLNRFLRDWRRNESTKMDPELFDLLWEVQQEFGGRKIHIVSAYRSPATNSMLRRRSRGVARNSQHMQGRAIDFFIPGAKISKVRQEGMKRQVGGVGYYPRSGSPFVHFDTGRVRSWPRMPRGQLARLFPDGKTLHLPSNGKPLKGYAAAQKAEKAGKLASLNSRGGGRRSLFGFGGSGRGAASDEPTRGIVRQKQTPRPAAPQPADEPVRVRTASLGPVATKPAEKDEERGGFLRQLPTASLGGLIGRFRRDKEPEPNVTPVALPAEPLTAIANEGATTPRDGAIGRLLADERAPIPRVAPRDGRGPAQPAAADGADGAGVPIQLAALPPQRPEFDAVATDALGYARDVDASNPASAQRAATALIPRDALSSGEELRELLPQLRARSALQQQLQPSRVSAALSPVRGASPLLIADGTGIDEQRFATFTAPDRVTASKTGVLLANGFLGERAGFASANAWLDTERFTGLRITVYASPRS